MPPPNFARKKRKSRSRGASAKRAAHAKSDSLGSAFRADKRSSSVEVSSDVSREIEKDLGCNSVNHSREVASKEASVIALANDVAAAAIATAESSMKSHLSKKSTIKKEMSKGSQGKISSSNSVPQTKTETPKMVQDEDKLKNLCDLLERLDTTYGKNSCESSPVKKDPTKEKVPDKKDVKMKVEKGNIKKDQNVLIEEKVIPKVGKNCMNHDATPGPKDEEISQEEKQALRKAKKESKKLSKHKGEATIDPLSQQEAEVCNHEASKEHKRDVIPVANHVPEKVAPEVQPQGTSEKSKADLKRERREKQEAQRAAKEAAKQKETLQKKEVTCDKQTESVKSETRLIKPPSKRKEEKLSERRLPLLDHLSTPKAEQPREMINSQSIHPAIRAVGISMRDMTLDGCIARVLATLSAISSLIEHYKTPPSCDLSRDLSAQLASNIAFLNSCRPIFEPINNAIRFVKREINKVDSAVPERQAKEELIESLQTYVHQNIVLASETIIDNALQFIEEEDVILTFGFSSLVYETVKAAAAIREKEKLCLVVVDNPGVPSGVNLLQSLVQLGVKVYYRILQDLPHIIDKVTKVVVEAEAVVLNGAVIGRCGMAGLILQASCHSVPVIVLSHTFKFCNIDLTDSFVVNELGDSSAVVNCPSSSLNRLLADWKNIPSLNVVNLIYDVTPSHLINVLVTEFNNFPTSVVPVIIKRNYADILGHD